MPPLPVIADAFRVTFNWHTDAFGITAHNVMHFLGLGFDSPSVYDAINLNVAHEMFQHTNVTTSVNSVDVLPLDGTSPTSTFPNSDVTEWRGTGSTQLTVPVCALVNLKTGLRGRSHRGRLYLPWVCENAQNGGVLSGTIGADMTAAWEAFRTAMTASGLALMVASYTNDDIQAVTQCTVENDCATQRRRQDALRRTM
jgi:hypothetical protein